MKRDVEFHDVFEFRMPVTFTFFVASIDKEVREEREGESFIVVSEVGMD